MTDHQVEANIARDLRHTPERGDGSGGWVRSVRYLVKELADVRAERDSAEASALHIHGELDAAEAKLAALSAPRTPTEEERPIGILDVEAVYAPRPVSRTPTDPAPALLSVLEERGTNCTMHNPLPCDQKAPDSPRQWCNECIIRNLLALPLSSGRPEREFLNRLRLGDSIVCSDGCTEMEIAQAQACGRFLNIDGLGYIYRPRMERPRCLATIQASGEENPHQCFRLRDHEGEHEFDALMILNGPIQFLPLSSGRTPEPHWQPIETAPRDATTLIGISRKIPERWIRVGLGTNLNGEWMWSQDVPWEPATHFMRCPALPASSSRPPMEQK